jgi:hypothetical protein
MLLKLRDLMALPSQMLRARSLKTAPLSAMNNSDFPSAELQSAAESGHLFLSLRLETACDERHDLKKVLARNLIREKLIEHAVRNGEDIKIREGKVNENVFCEPLRPSCSHLRSAIFPRIFIAESHDGLEDLIVRPELCEEIPKIRRNIPSQVSWR